MWADWQINGVVGGFQAIGTYIQQSRKAKNDRKWQAYNNAMTRMQDGLNQSNINTNQNMAVERQVRESYALRVAEYQTSSKAEAAAAAVGAEGNSVDKVLLEVSNNEARMQQQLRTDMNYQMVGFQNQRQSSALQTQMQLDFTQIPKPNLASSLLSWGADTMKGWWESKLK